MIRKALLATITLALLAAACGEDRPNLTLPSRPSTTVGTPAPDTVAPEGPAPDTVSPETLPPETQPPATAPPATAPPATAPPATAPPQTLPPETALPTDTLPTDALPADEDGGTNWWWLLLLLGVVGAVVAVVVRRRSSSAAADTEWSRRVELAVTDAQRMLALAPTLVPGAATDMAIRGQAAQVEQSLSELPAEQSVDRRAAVNAAAAATRAWSAGFEAAALQRRSVPPPTAEALESVDAVLEARRLDLEQALELLRQS